MHPRHRVAWADLGSIYRLPGYIAQFVGTAHALGMKAFADPAKNAQTFGYFGSLGFDGAYCDDIPNSLALQPPLQ